MPRVPINGIEIDYQEHGEGEAIVFCHGAGGNLLSWWQQIPYFSKSYRCITFSHRGFGHSYDVPDGPGMKSFVEGPRRAARPPQSGFCAPGVTVHGRKNRARLRRGAHDPDSQPRSCRHDRRHGRTRRRAGTRRLVETSDTGTRAGLPSAGTGFRHSRAGACEPVPPDIPHQSAQAADRRSTERRSEWARSWRT